MTDAQPSVCVIPAPPAVPRIKTATKKLVALRRLGIALVGAIALLVVGMQQAQAHAVLIGTTPGDGQVATSVSSVELKFNEALIDQFAVVYVADASGRRIDQGPAVVTGDAVRQATEMAEGGQYVVSWRMVSKDGHPITGQFSFTVQAAVAHATTQPTAAATSAAASPSLAAAPRVTDSATPVDDAEASTEHGSETGRVVVAGAVLVFLLAGGMWLVNRKHRKRPAQP